MRVIHLVENLDETYGGPAVSVPELAAALADLGVETMLMSIAWRTGERNPTIARFGLPWQRYPLDGPRKLGISRGLARAAGAATREPAVIHVHNLWNGVVVAGHRAARRLGIPLVVSPRGSLYDWSLAQGRWRKRSAWRLFQKRILDAAAFADADVFVCPSHSENFAVVVAEALAAGLPVIATAGTPWREIAEVDAGWWIELSVDNLRMALDAAATCEAERLAAMGERGRALVQRYGWPAQAQRMLAAYRWALGTAAKPDDVSEGPGADERVVAAG